MEEMYNITVPIDTLIPLISKKNVTKGIYFRPSLYKRSLMQLEALNKPQLNKKWSYEYFSSNNFYDHLVYEGKFQEIFKKSIGDYLNKNNDSGSLLVFENFVFFSDEKGKIYKFDISNQKIIWELKIYESSYNNYPKNIALFLNGDVLYAADNLGFIYSIDVQTGKTIWQQNYGIPFSSHLNFHKGILYVVNQNSRLYAFNPSDGQKIWSFESLSGLIKPSRSSNISLYDNKLLFSNDVGDITSIDLDQQVIIWTKNILSQNTISNNLVFKISNILIDKKDVFVSSNSGDLFNFNLETGEIKWSQKLSSIQNHISTDKYLFVLTENAYVDLELEFDQGDTPRQVPVIITTIGPGGTHVEDLAEVEIERQLIIPEKWVPLFAR